MATKKQPKRAGAKKGETTRKKRVGAPAKAKGAEAVQSAAASGGVPDELFRMHANKALREKNDLDEATKKRSAQNGRYRAALKAAEKDGISADDIIWFINNRARTPEDMAAEARRQARVARIMSMDVGYQMSFSDVETEPTEDRGVMQHKAHQAGYTDGKAGQAADEDRYPNDPDLQGRYNDGHADGKADLTAGLGGKNRTNGNGAAEAGAQAH